MFKKFLEKKGISAEQFKELEAEKQAELQNEYLGEIEAQVGKTATKEELKSQLDAAKTEIKSSVEGLAEELNLLTEKIREFGNNQEETKTLAKEIDEKKDAIKNIVSGMRGEVEVKALTTRASIVGNTNAYALPNIGQLGVKLRALYDVLPKIQLSTNANDNGVIKYQDWDEATTVRAAASVAEGTAFPESTAKFIEKTIPIRKIGDTLPVTEEFGEDSALAAAELERFVDINVNSVIDSQLINGAGTGETLTGLLASAPDYTPVAAGIAGANIKDLVRKMRTAIVKDRGSKYSPDIVVMNSDTFDRYYLAKDSNNNYLFDSATGTIAGLTVVEDNNMPNNQIVVGDRRFATIYEKGGVVLSEGFVNAQFSSDAKTLKARKRMAMLIREVDKTGFLHCTDVNAALVTLAT